MRKLYQMYTLFSLLYLLGVTSMTLRDHSGGASPPPRIDCPETTVFLLLDTLGAGPDDPSPSDPGTSRSHIYKYNQPLETGQFTIAPGSAGWSLPGENWIEIGDQNGDPESYIALYNGAGSGGAFWEQQIGVCPGIVMEFSVDVINLTAPAAPPAARPNLDLLLDGTVVASLGDIPQDGQWHTYSFSITVPEPDPVYLALRNNTGESQGNDFAIDNLILQTCAPSIQLLESDPQPRCAGDSVRFQAVLGNGFAAPVIQWQVSTDDGNTWSNTGGPVTQSGFSVAAVPMNARYRALAAASSSNLESPSCSAVSNVVAPAFRPVADCFDSPVEVIGELCQGVTGMPLVPGGNFGGGEESFGPALTGDTTTLAFAGTDTFPGPGQYVRAQNFRDDPCRGAFPDTCWIPVRRDTTDSTSYRLIVNADGEPDIFFQAEVTGLCENTIYQFSAEVVNLSAPFFFPNNPDGTDTAGLPNIDLIVAPPGAPRELLQLAPATFNSGDIPNDTITRTIGFTFEMKPGETDILIAVRNNGPGGFGNDLALDNVSVAVCGPPSTVAYDPVCRGQSITLNAVIDGNQFPDPAIQWIESLDSGASWSAVTGATGRTLLLPDPVSGAQYSFLVAADEQKLQNPNCRINATPNAIEFLPEGFTTIDTSICSGETIRIGENSFAASGAYTVALPSGQACDSIVQLNLIVREEIRREQTVVLCPGERYEGLQPSSDTTLTDTFTTASGCDSILFTRIRLSLLKNFAISGDTTICGSDASVLDAGEQAAYQWSTGATTQTITAPATGTYSVTVTDTFGCTASDSADVVIGELQTLVVAQPPSCPGDTDGSILIAEVSGASEPVAYAIGEEPFQSEPVFNNLRPDDYDIRVRDARGCTYREEVTVHPAEALFVRISPVSAIRPGDTVQLSVEVNRTVATATWEPPAGLSCSDCLEPVAAPLQTTPYRLTVVDTAGCEDAAFVRIRVEHALPLFAPNAFSPDGDGINDRFTLYSNQQVRQIDRLLIFDRWGGLVFERNGLDVNDEAAGWDGTRLGRQCSPGVYVFYAEITLEDGTADTVKGEVMLMR